MVCLSCSLVKGLMPPPPPVAAILSGDLDRGTGRLRALWSETRERSCGLTDLVLTAASGRTSEGQEVPMRSHREGRRTSCLWLKSRRGRDGRWSEDASCRPFLKSHWRQQHFGCGCSARRPTGLKANKDQIWFLPNLRLILRRRHSVCTNLREDRG